MSWLLFLDESGHDHHNTPYEVHGGFALHTRKLWPFISAVRTLQQSIFGLTYASSTWSSKAASCSSARRLSWRRRMR